MTKQETAKVLAVLQEIYTIHNQNPDHLLTIWHRIFKEADDQAVMAAAEQFIREDTTGNYHRFPTPGQIMGVLKQRCQETMDTAEEAWQQVLRAARNGMHDSRGEFERLSEPVKQAVDHPGFIRELAMANAFQRDTMKGVFLKNYAAVRETVALTRASCAAARLPEGKAPGRLE